MGGGAQLHIQDREVSAHGCRMREGTRPRSAGAETGSETSTVTNRHARDTIASAHTAIRGHNRQRAKMEGIWCPGGQKGAGVDTAFLSASKESRRSRCEDHATILPNYCASTNAVRS
jgi:hypothetical protein